MSALIALSLQQNTLFTINMYKRNKKKQEISIHLILIRNFSYTKKKKKTLLLIIILKV